MWIKETFIDRTRNAQFGSSEWYEPFHADNIGALYRDLLKEYGRCTGKIYVDPKGGGQPIQQGWVFLSRQAYEDSRRTPPETYLREVWVEVSVIEPERRMVQTVWPKSPWDRRTPHALACKGNLDNREKGE